MNAVTSDFLDSDSLSQISLGYSLFLAGFGCRPLKMSFSLHVLEASIAVQREASSGLELVIIVKGSMQA